MYYLLVARATNLVVSCFDFPCPAMREKKLHVIETGVFEISKLIDQYDWFVFANSIEPKVRPSTERTDPRQYASSHFRLRVPRRSNLIILLVNFPFPRHSFGGQRDPSPHIITSINLRNKQAKPPN